MHYKKLIIFKANRTKNFYAMLFQNPTRLYTIIRENKQNCNRFDAKCSSKISNKNTKNKSLHLDFELLLNLASISLQAFPYCSTHILPHLHLE